jgi:Icc-related predicted phosphoesterase
LDLSIIRCLVVADLHYSLPQFDWLLAAAPQFDLVIFAGDALDIGSFVDFRAQIVVVKKYLTLLSGVTRVILAAFKKLYGQREALEAKFGETLDWQELPGRKGCRICKDLNGGWRTPEAEWPAMQDAILDTLVRLEAALRGPIQQIG